MKSKILAMNVKKELIKIIQEISAENAASLIPIAKSLMVTERALTPKTEVLKSPMNKPVESGELAEEIEAFDGMKFRKIPATSKKGVILGLHEPCGPGRCGSHPERTVVFSEPFYMGIYPVTNREWNFIARDPLFYSVNLPMNPSAKYGFRFTPDDIPVVGVNWYEAVKFSLLHSLPDMQQSKQNEIWRRNSGFQIPDDNLRAFLKQLIKERTPMDRLPTENEWEYSAAAGARTKFPSGDNIENLCNEAVFRSNVIKPVGTKAPNKFGLFDMIGLVDEWSNDYYGDIFVEKRSTHNGFNSHFDEAVTRGASFNEHYSFHLTVYARSSFKPFTSSSQTGFRLVRTVT